jgi:hypothetical protein
MSDPTLVTRIEALEATIANLREQLEQARRLPRYVSMHRAKRCPECGGRSLFQVRVQLASSADLVPQPMILAYYARSIWRSPVAQGVLECYACRSCGLVEWHASELDKVTADGEHVIAIETPSESPSDDGPYR